MIELLVSIPCTLTASKLHLRMRSFMRYPVLWLIHYVEFVGLKLLHMKKTGTIDYRFARLSYLHMHPAMVKKDYFSFTRINCSYSLLKYKSLLFASLFIKIVLINFLPLTCCHQN